MAGLHVFPILGVPEVDCAVDYVGSEAHGIGHEAHELQPQAAINQVLAATRAGGGGCQQLRRARVSHG